MKTALWRFWSEWRECSCREPGLVTPLLNENRLMAVLVGVARFELAALRSRTVRATKLRYTPILLLNYLQRHFESALTLCLVARTRSPKVLPRHTFCVPTAFLRGRALRGGLHCNPNCATPRFCCQTVYNGTVQVLLPAGGYASTRADIILSTFGIDVKGLSHQQAPRDECGVFSRPRKQIHSLP